MKLKFSPGVPDLGCIYLITHKSSGRQYVGSTRRPRQRRHDHISGLRRGVHLSRTLQRDWDAGRPEDFVFMIVEWAEAQKLQERELHWMNKVNPEYNTYGCSGTGDRNLRGDYTKSSMSPERREEVTNAVKARWAEKRRLADERFRAIMRGEAEV